MKIFIDVGHGGTETGAIGHGMVEKNINLVVAVELKRILVLNGQDVKMSRESDLTIGLSERCTMANQWGADLFVSVHHNANDGKTLGAEIYSSVKGGEGADLANSIAKVLNHYGRPTATRQIEGKNGQDYYAVIRQTNMASIITEYGYMDSLDYINFDSTAELLEEGRRFAEGVLTYLGVNPIKYTDTQIKGHWAQEPFNYLKSRGMKINETRFDDKITRGEVFALLAQIIK